MTMNYCTSLELLLSTFDQACALNVLDRLAVDIHHCDFTSRNSDVLPGADAYCCGEHHAEFGPDPMNEEEDGSAFHDSLSVPDCGIRCNVQFRYSLFKPRAAQKARSVILMLNGLNEKRWDKYLPWALALAERTGKAVLLFPIAFHMNRTPVEWSTTRTMSAVASERQRRYPAIAHSSFANAAISTRLQSAPQRFFWSGLQTYLDLVQLVHEIRRGDHERIAPDASIDIFAYSIGTFLWELVLMTDPDGLFTHSRLFMFCGGPTLDRMYPGSRYIMDSEAVIALHSFLIEHLDNEFRRHRRLAHYFTDHHEVWDYFRAMLSNPKMKQLREERFRALSARIQALVLKQDDVIPPVEVINTLQGDFRDIPITVHLKDFPYSYTHVAPFPHAKGEAASQVDRCFADVFDIAASFLH